MNPFDLKFLTPAVVTEKKGQPFTEAFDDVYFNDLNGLDETKHVFINGNKLIERWQKKQNHHFFCIGETGFGSGLNFLATCLAWQKCQSKPQHLHFISTELYPLSRSDLESAHVLFPALRHYSQKLLSQYGSFRCGAHQLHIDEQITLTLLLGDAAESLKQLVATVDAWYLDGFAPSRNPEMWSADLFNAMAAMSKSETTLATYSAASVVKKGLTQAGFSLTKQTGYGPKRDMLVGTYHGTDKQPSNKQPWHPIPKANIKQKKVTILGGGIAGLSLARSFSLAGFHTTIVDQNDQPLLQASGNGYAMVMPLITAQKSPEALFYLRAFEHSKRLYSTEVFHETGVSEFFHAQREAKRVENLKTLPLCKQLIQVTTKHIKYPNSGFVDAPALADDWLNYVDQWITAKVNSIEHRHGWQLKGDTQQNIHSCDLLIIAAGMHSQTLIKPHQALGLTAKLGQTHQISTHKNLKLSEVQLNQGYLIPVNQSDLGGHYLLGATFDHLADADWYQTENNEVDHLDRNLAHWLKTDWVNELIDGKLISQHTAIRATTQDHLPLCGPVINQPQFELDYQDLHHGRHWQNYPPAQPIENLYVLTGLGSRGFTSAPFLADYLSAMITGQPLPLELDLCKIIHPNRFNFRNLKKAKTKNTQ